MGFLDSIAAGLLGFASNMVGNKINQAIANTTNKYNYAINKENIEFAREMYDKQVAYEWDMFNAENAYNSPSAQRKRLEDAGLNPYLMMSGGSAGTSSGGSHPSANQPSQIPMQGYQYQPYDPSAAFSYGLAGVSTSSEVALRKSQSNKLDAEAASAWSDAQYKDAMNKLALAQLVADISGTNAKTKGQMLENIFANDTLQARKHRVDIDNEYQREQINNLRLNQMLVQAQLPTVSAIAQAQLENLTQDVVMKKLQAKGISQDNIKKQLENRNYQSITDAELARIYADVALKNKQKLNLPTLTPKQAEQLGKAMVDLQEWQRDAAEQDYQIRRSEVKSANAREALPSWWHYVGEGLKTWSPLQFK